MANLLDRAIAYFAPQAAARRAQARTVAGVWTDFGEYYSGGSRTRRSMRTFNPGAGSADLAVLSGQDMLRRRSRDLARNSPVGAGAIAGVVTAVVGEGITPHPRVDAEALGWNEARAEAWEAQVAREYKLWAGSTACDARGVQNMAGLQALAFRSVMESGDCFSLLPIRKKPEQPYSLRVRLFEADQVCNPDENPDDDKIAGGVEVDDFDAVTAYHMLERHPGGLDPNAGVPKWKRIPAVGPRSGRRNILHLFEPTRPGQRRGVPFLTPVIESLKQLERYTEAELFAAVVASMFTVFVKRDKNGKGGLDVPGLPTVLDTADGQADPKVEYALGMGTVVEMDDGQSIEIANPSRPNAQFDPFFLAVMQQVGMALQIPLEVLLKVFRSSYSASRAALQEAWRFYDNRIAWLVSMFCQPVYEEWMAEAVALGRISAPGFFKDPVARSIYCEADWIGPTEYTLDPVKEVKAAAEMIDAELSTREREAYRLTGTSWRRNHAQRVKEENARRRDGLLPPPAQAKPMPEKPEPDQDDEEEKP